MCPPGPLSLQLNPNAPEFDTALPLSNIKNEPGYIENCPEFPLHLSIKIVDKEALVAPLPSWRIPLDTPKSLWIKHCDRLVNVATHDCDLVSRLTLKILATPAILSLFGYSCPPGPLGLHLTPSPPAFLESLPLEDIQYADGYIENGPEFPLYLSVKSMPKKAPVAPRRPRRIPPGTPKSLWIRHSDYLVQLPTHDCDLVTDLKWKIIMNQEICSQFGYKIVPGHTSLHVTPNGPALDVALPLAKIKNEPGYIENSAECPLYLHLMDPIVIEVRIGCER